MSHALTIRQQSPIVVVMVEILNYTTGGETILPAELQLASVDGIIFGQCPPGQNSLGVVLFPQLIGGKVQLFQFVSGSPVQIATTANLNATFAAMVVSAG